MREQGVHHLIAFRYNDACASTARQNAHPMGKLIANIICMALSLVAAYLTLVLFYGLVLMVFHYAFGIELWNPFQGTGAGMS
jgi:hypothetical protein